MKMAGQDRETEVHLSLDKNPLYSAVLQSFLRPDQVVGASGLILIASESYGPDQNPARQPLAPSQVFHKYLFASGIRL